MQTAVFDVWEVKEDEIGEEVKGYFECVEVPLADAEGCKLKCVAEKFAAARWLTREQAHKEYCAGRSMTVAVHRREVEQAGAVRFNVACKVVVEASAFSKVIEQVGT